MYYIPSLTLLPKKKKKAYLHNACAESTHCKCAFKRVM